MMVSGCGVGVASEGLNCVYVCIYCVCMTVCMYVCMYVCMGVGPGGQVVSILAL